MKYLRIDHSEVVDNAHLARLMWPDSLDQPHQLQHHAQFYAVPEDHVNIAFIACLARDPVWYGYPQEITEPRQVRIFA